MEFILRKVTEHQVYNESIGSAYSVIDKECNPEDFEHYTKSHFGQDCKEENVKDIVKFIISSYAIPIYKDDNCYMMTESGKTFERINSNLKE